MSSSDTEELVPRAQLLEAQAALKQAQEMLSLLEDVRRDPHTTPADMGDFVRECVAMLVERGWKKAPEREELLVLHGENVRDLSFVEQPRGGGDWREFRHNMPRIVGPVEIIVRRARYATLDAAPPSADDAARLTPEEARAMMDAYAPPGAGAQPLTPRMRECARGMVGHIYVLGRCACGAHEPIGVGHGAG